MKRDDTLWKGILEDLFIHFLRFFFKDADSLFDLKKGFEYLDKEMEQISKADELQPSKFLDKLVKVYSNEGEEQWVLVHIEIQGYIDKKFEERMYVYNYRIFDRYRKRIAAIAILTDKDKSYRPTEYHTNFLGTETIFRFKTYKVLDQDVAMLGTSGNPFAFVILTVLLSLQKRKIDETELLQQKIELAKRLLDKKFPKPVIRGIYYFIRNYVVFENIENERIFDSTIESITDKTKTMGVFEMIKEREVKAIQDKGKVEAKAEVITNLIVKLGLSDEQAADVAGVSVSFVAEIRMGLRK